MGGTVISASAAPKSNNVALDTVRTTFDDGRVARIYTVKKGTDIREGVALSYHPNGKLAVEAPYRNGKLDGVFRSFDENGKLHETIGYLDGEEEGFSIIYYENGKRKAANLIVAAYSMACPKSGLKMVSSVAKSLTRMDKFTVSSSSTMRWDF